MKETKQRIAEIQKEIFEREEKNDYISVKYWKKILEKLKKKELLTLDIN